MTSEVPKKLRTWGQAGGTIIGVLSERVNDLAAQQVKRARTFKQPVEKPVPKLKLK
jgi:hypothetical protein